MAGISRKNTGGRFWSLDALLGADELFQALSRFPTLTIFDCGWVPVEDTGIISLEEFVATYEKYVGTLTGAALDSEAHGGMYVSMTLNDSIIRSEPCSDPAFKLFEESKPVVHTQLLDMAYFQQSNMMRVHCTDTRNPIRFGLTFSHPNVWADHQADPSKPKTRTRFPNIDLIEGLTAWVKRHSEPCKLTLPGREQVLPVRLGREAARWVNEHTALARLGISVRSSRPARAEPSWLTTVVVELARAIREEKDYALLPILADALEDAGCADDAVLRHCREQDEHVRGCWVVDMVLG